MDSSPGSPSLSIIIPNRNGAAYLPDCLQSLARQTWSPFELIIVDDASSDDSIEIVRRLAPSAEVVTLRNNLGFAGAVNAGSRRATGEWIVVLNNDTEAADDWLEECAAALHRHPEADFLACRILDFHDRRRLYSAGDCFLRLGVGYRRGQSQDYGDRYRQEAEIFGASGCAAVYRAKVWRELGGFDETFFAYLEDVDFALRLQSAGHRGYYIPGAVVYHRGGGTSGGEFAPLSVRLRTRNSILLVLKHIRGRRLWAALPMLLAGQFSWLVRALLHGRLWSYARGLAGVFSLLPGALRFRKASGSAPESEAALWSAIRRSEALAKLDFPPDASRVSSLFLNWYFRLF